MLVFGSAASTLSVPESDIDLTLHLPSRVKLVQELKVSNSLPCASQLRPLDQVYNLRTLMYDKVRPPIKKEACCSGADGQCQCLPSYPYPKS